MEQHVTFETARRLKRLTLLPRKIEVGQIWYTPLQFSYVVVKNDGHHVGSEENTFYVVGLNAPGRPEAKPMPASAFGQMIWAPTALDILSRLALHAVRTQISHPHPLWIVENSAGSFASIISQNAAEAAADAFLRKDYPSLFNHD